MNITGVEIHPTTGQITIVYEVPPNMLDSQAPMVPGNIIKWLGEGEGVADPRLQFFNLEMDQLQDRPVMPVDVSKLVIDADDLDEALITDIPQGAEVFLDDELIEDFEGSTLEFTSPMSATYNIRIEKWPYLPVDLEIVAA